MDGVSRLILSEWVNRTNLNRKLQESELPKLLFFAHPGGILRPAMVEWCKQNLKNLKTVDIGPGIHYLQEDNPQLINTLSFPQGARHWFPSLDHPLDFTQSTSARCVQRRNPVSSRVRNIEGGIDHPEGTEELLREIGID